METVEKSEIQSHEIMNEEFCKKHLSLQRESSLSRKKYCKGNNINYTQFSYWLRKFSLIDNPTIPDERPSPLMAIKLKAGSESLPRPAEAICTLGFKNGCLLKIHTMEALSVILERMS